MSFKKDSILGAAAVSYQVKAPSLKVTEARLPK